MKYIRKCPACEHENMPDEIFCEKCTNSIASIKSTLVEENSSKESEEAANVSGTEEESGFVRICPDCGAELDSQAHYPRCRRLVEGFTLVWQNIPMQPIRLTKDIPLFIGRVPPVCNELAQYIEESHRTVSRNHAEIYIGDDGKPYLRDMNSVNGSFVNNQQVPPFIRTMLYVGDVVSFSHSLSIVIN